MFPTMRHSLRAAAKGSALAAIFLQAVLSLSAGERLDLSKTILKTEHFDKDPGWEGHNNRVVPKVVKTVEQDFGYRATNFAGKAKGEIGGTIWRSPTLASYAAKIPVKTLHDKLTASGTFAVTASSGSSGVFVGWFKAERPGGGRQNTLGLRFAGQGSGARLRRTPGNGLPVGRPFRADRGGPEGPSYVTNG
jgi:hypothetical protein